jgi:hypothetical protein
LAEAPPSLASTTCRRQELHRLRPRHCQCWRSDHPRVGHRAVMISGPKPLSVPPVVAAASRRPPLPPRARPATAGRHAVARATALPRPCEHAVPALRDRPTPSSQREGKERPRRRPHPAFGWRRLPAAARRWRGGRGTRERRARVSSRRPWEQRGGRRIVLPPATPRRWKGHPPPFPTPLLRSYSMSLGSRSSRRVHFRPKMTELAPAMDLARLS